MRVSPQTNPQTLQPSRAFLDQAQGWQGRAAHREAAGARRGDGELEDLAAKGGAIAKVRYTHDAVIDYIIQSPSVSQNELAALFGYTPGWVSQVMGSDAFRARLEQRKEELVDPQIRLTLNEKFNALVSRSLDVLQEKLMGNSVDPEIALRAAALGAKALGLGNAQGVTVNVGPSGDRLEHLANRLTGLLGQHRASMAAGQVIDV